MKYLSLFLVILSSKAFSQVIDVNNKPQILEVKSIERVVAFKGFKKNVWFTPTAFSVDFNCSPSNNKTTCSLRVFNRLSNSELTSLQEVTSEGQQLLQLSDIDSGIVSQIEGRFRDLPPRLTDQNVVMNTLAMSAQFPYASALARFDQLEASTLKTQFETVGLGTFETRFKIQAERSEDFLALLNPAPLILLLKSTSGRKMRLSTLKSELNAAIAKSSVFSMNHTVEQEIVAAYRAARLRFYNQNKQGLFETNESEIDSITKQLILIDDSEATTLTCTSSLELKRDALSVTHCGEEEK